MADAHDAPDRGRDLAVMRVSVDLPGRHTPAEGYHPVSALAEQERKSRRCRGNKRANEPLGRSSY